MKTVTVTDTGAEVLASLRGELRDTGSLFLSYLSKLRKFFDEQWISLGMSSREFEQNCYVIDEMTATLSALIETPGAP